MSPGTIQPCYRTANGLYQWDLPYQGRGNEYHPIGSPQFFRQSFPTQPTPQSVQKMTYGVFGNNSNWPFQGPWRHSGLPEHLFEAMWLRAFAFSDCNGLQRSPSILGFPRPSPTTRFSAGQPTSLGANWCQFQPQVGHKRATRW